MSSFASSQLINLSGVPIAVQLPLYSVYDPSVPILELPVMFYLISHS
jgi:hypothetical protein